MEEINFRNINVGIDFLPSYQISNSWNLFLNLGVLKFENRKGELISDFPEFTDEINTNKFTHNFSFRNIQLGAEWLF